MNRQETLWHGDFGREYHLRNSQIDRAGFWNEILATGIDLPVASVLELGAGQGDNLSALRSLFPEAKLTGVDINPLAVELMRDRGFEAIEGSIHSVKLPKADLVFTRGTLIHVQPNYLPRTYADIHAAALRYIVLAEYFSPEPREIPYRGKGAALWARDFMGDMLSQFSDLTLVDYGFVYKGAGHDESLNWFLAEKTEVKS